MRILCSKLSFDTHTTELEKQHKRIKDINLPFSSAWSYFSIIVELLCTSLSEYFVVCDGLNEQFYIQSNVVHLKTVANCQKNSHDTHNHQRTTISDIGKAFCFEKFCFNLSRVYRTGVLIIRGVLITRVRQQCSLIFFFILHFYSFFCIYARFFSLFMRFFFVFVLICLFCSTDFLNKLQVNMGFCWNCVLYRW